MQSSVKRESPEKSFTINLRQKKAEIKQLLAPFTRPLSRGRNKWKEKKSDLLYPPPGEATGGHWAENPKIIKKLQTFSILKTMPI